MKTFGLLDITLADAPKGIRLPTAPRHSISYQHPLVFLLGSKQSLPARAIYARSAPLSSLASAEARVPPNRKKTKKTPLEPNHRPIKGAGRGNLRVPISLPVSSCLMSVLSSAINLHPPPASYFLLEVVLRRDL